MLDEVQKEFTRLVRNPNWYGKKPAMDEVIFRFYADANAEFQALKSGEIDALDGVPEQSYASIENDDTITGIAGNQGGFSELSMNSGLLVVAGRRQSCAEGQVKVRQAINYAIDRDLLVEKTLVGHGIPGTAIVPSADPAWDLKVPDGKAVQVRPRQGQGVARRGRLDRHQRRRRPRQGRQRVEVALLRSHRGRRRCRTPTSSPAG